LKLAVVTLSVLAVVLISATIYESETSTRQAQSLIYQSWWFLGLLSLLALNVFGSAMARYPWKSGQTGFVITHFGILVLLAGAIVGLVFGIEGHITLVEGGPPVSVLNRDYEAVQVTRPDTGQTATIPLPADLPSDPGRTRYLAAKPLPLTVGIKARLANTRDELVVKEGGSEVNPAVRFTFRSAMGGEGTNQMQMSEWLVARDEQRRAVSLGPSVFRLESVATPELLRQRLAPPPAAAASGKGTLTVVAKQQSITVPVEPYLGKTFKSTNGTLSVIIKNYFADFRMDTQSRQPTSVSDVPNNPAVAFEVVLPEGHVVGFSFADFPEMGILRSETLPADAVQVTYQFERPNRGGMNPRSTSTFTFLAGPENQLHYVSLTSGTNFHSGELKVGQRMTLPWKVPAELTVDEFYPQPRISLHAVPAPVEPGDNFTRPALTLQVGPTDQGQVITLPWGERQTVSVAGAPYQLVYGSGTSPLGFSLQLSKFKVPKFEGTAMPASFESTVKVNDLRSGRSLEDTIWMNHPLSYGGYRISQASYQEGTDGGPNQSTLQFLHDPGWPFKWSGSLLIIAGISIMFYYKPRNQKDKPGGPERETNRRTRPQREPLPSARMN
jgi:hypothetical protein